jgi:hypothetical protein
MKASKYFCFIVGESFDKAKKFHPSTIRRLNAFALAIHIPVILWAITGFLIASKIFNLSLEMSAFISWICAMSIYLVERIVIATPKSFCVSFLRTVIGLVIAILGASSVDLIIFEREISEQLQINARQRVIDDFNQKTASIKLSMDQKKADWQRAQDAANCEANGTCGSRLRSVGPVYRELARQSDVLRKDYLTEQQKFDLLNSRKLQDIEKFSQPKQVNAEAGLLSRIKALHEYTTQNTTAFVAWILFLSLVLLFELMVVISKAVFGETVDDELDRIRESISQEKARAYKEAITSPMYGARELVYSTLAN